MSNHTTIARAVREDIRNAIAAGTLDIPPCVNPHVRVDRRGLMPSVNVYFPPTDRTRSDADHWKYTHDHAGYSSISTAFRAAIDTITDMINERSGGTAAVQASIDGAITAIIMPTN